MNFFRTKKTKRDVYKEEIEWVQAINIEDSLLTHIFQKYGTLMRYNVSPLKLRKIAREITYMQHDRPQDVHQHVYKIKKHVTGNLDDLIKYLLAIQDVSAITVQDHTIDFIEAHNLTPLQFDTIFRTLNFNNVVRREALPFQPSNDETTMIAIKFYITDLRESLNWEEDAGEFWWDMDDLNNLDGFLQTTLTPTVIEEPPSWPPLKSLSEVGQDVLSRHVSQLQKGVGIVGEGAQAVKTIAYDRTEKAGTFLKEGLGVGMGVDFMNYLRRGFEQGPFGEWLPYVALGTGSLIVYTLAT